MDGFRNERFCPVCGKLYYVARYNKYKIKQCDAGLSNGYRIVNVCSYGCMRKWEAKNE